MTRLLIGCLALSLVGTAAASAQTSPPDVREALHLADLQREARSADPRARELDLLMQQADLRAQNIDVERRPSFSVLGQTQYTSDAPSSPFNGPDGQPLFGAPKFTYDGSLRVDQKLYDASLEPRRELTRADLAESQARVRTALFALRQEVNDAFFTAALLQEQLGALTATLDDLAGRLSEMTKRVTEGTALPGEAAAIEATLLQQRQQADALRASRAAALARLSALTGRTINSNAVMALTDSAESVAHLREAMLRERARPEYEQFDRARDHATRQQEMAHVADRPQASVYGRAGYGRPGLNFISDQPEFYGLAGVQFQWKAWAWGTSGRERDVLAIQQTIVSAEEDAFTRGLRRAIEVDLAAVEHLETSLPTDDRIVALRESIDRTARVRLDAGVITASEYLDRHTEWLTAQFDRARHRVELAQARANVQTKLGLEVQ